jgi:mono/diheme cytochrome c family protein
MTRTLATLFISALGLHAATIAADSTRGAQLFETLSCVQCHRVNGKGGGTVGPDLGRRIDRDFTPASLAATMWNHAPAMWASMRARNVQSGDLNEQAASDLFAYFYSARFFEKPGDAGRGKRLFSSKHCAECHGLTGWQSIGQPMELVNALWNHASTMRQEFANKKLNWPELTAQDLTDMLVYLRNLPSAPSAAGIDITAGTTGLALFEAKGCAACHSGKAALTSRIKGRTLTDIAVAMWNHEPRMPTAPPPMSLPEMREIVSYLWAEQFFEDAGNPAAGARVFASKGCAACHNDPSPNNATGAPKLTGAGRTYSAATIVSVLWHHGPQMLDQMKTRGIAWPRFDGPQMANLIAYLNGRNKVQQQGK